jgi:hypothetical protein
LFTGIIVRDDEARLRLLSELGDVPGLVFTVLDSKGLEFDDVCSSGNSSLNIDLTIVLEVLLLNFFRGNLILYMAGGEI